MGRSLARRPQPSAFYPLTPSRLFPLLSPPPAPFPYEAPSSPVPHLPLATPHPARSRISLSRPRSHPRANPSRKRPGGRRRMYEGEAWRGFRRTRRDVKITQLNSLLSCRLNWGLAERCGVNRELPGGTAGARGGPRPCCGRGALETAPSRPASRGAPGGSVRCATISSRRR